MAVHAHVRIAWKIIKYARFVPSVGFSLLAIDEVVYSPLNILFVFLITMAQRTWQVSLNKQGRPMTVQVQATSQSEARQHAEHQYPGYKAGAAKQI